MLRLVLALSVLFASTSALAAGQLVRQSNGSYQVQALHQTNSYLTIEWKDGANVVKTTTCFSTCDNTPPAGGPYVVGYTLTHDDTREQLVSETCTGTVLGVGRCANGDYTAVLRPYLGDLNIVTDAGNDELAVTLTSIDLRFWFGPDKYWDRVGISDMFPVGSYEVEVTGYTALANCNPVPDRARYPLTIAPTGLSPQTVFSFDGTTCIFEFENDSARSVEVTNGVDSCTAPPSDFCTIEVPWRADTTFTASAGAGYTVHFNQGDAPCAGTENIRARCHEDKANSDYRQTAAVEMTVLDNAVAPAIIASVGSAPPADRVAAKGDQQAVIAHMHVEARNGPATIGALYVEVSGSANPSADFPMVRVFEDANNDGLVTAGEEQLGAQVMGDSGTAFVAISEAISTPRNFVVTVDIADELAARASIPGAPWSLIAIAAIPLAILYRRRRLALGLMAVALVVGAAYACGGGGGGSQDTDDDQQQTDTDNGGGDNGGDGGGDNGGGDIDVPPGAKTFAFRILGIAASSSTVAEGFPVDGASLSVTP